MHTPQKICQYIKNAGGQVKIEHLIEDCAPLGIKWIFELEKMRVIKRHEGIVTITEEGKELLS